MRDVVVAATAAGPLGPGESVTITIEADKYAHRLLMAAMLICTNDGFTAFDGVALPPMVGHTRTVRTVSLDAGTEINTEDFADIVPPCQALNGVSSDDAGTGATNPALAENSVIKRHRGITGIDDPDARGAWLEHPAPRGQHLHHPHRLSQHSCHSGTPRCVPEWAGSARGCRPGIAR